MPKPFLPYARQSIDEMDQQAVIDALHGDLITRGEYVEAFEQAIADYCNAKYAVAFNSATTALTAACFAAQVSPFDRVLSSPNTFIATVGAAMHFGAYPHFVDIDRETGNLDLQVLKEHLGFHSSRGKLVLFPIHFAGIALDMQELEGMLAAHPDAVIIEDAAHALGSSYADGQRVGCCAWSQMTVFSFHPAKIMTTGEGGMVTTNDPALYHRLQLYRNNGIEREAAYLRQTASFPGYYEVDAITGNFNFTEFQAALGLSQLKRLEHFIHKRRHLIQLYRQELRGTPHLKMFTDEFDYRTAFHLCVVQIDFDAYKTTREKVMNQLKEKGIGSQVHYIPLYLHPVFNQPGDAEAICPEMEHYYAQALSLPLYYDLKDEDVKRVCQELKGILDSKAK